MKYIPLNRQFSPVPENKGGVESNELFFDWGYSNQKSWEELEQEFRCVILAEAGAGKTEEFLQRAKCSPQTIKLFSPKLGHFYLAG